ncbi:MAG: carbon-nitrogen hydrolase [Betaproteobacteria bacterium]|nr:carbon-nitrogen hydrolase [Betaproteobacteria bacterium]
MKIALFQGPAHADSVDDALRVLADRAREAAASGARLLVCPEMFLTGYDIGVEALHRLAEPADGPSAQRAAAIARDHGIALLYGYPERERNTVWNSAMLLDASGRPLANHRKTHLFGELDRRAFAPGDRVVTTATLDGLCLAILICYEVEFPENVRLAALAGADLVAVPTALMAPYHFVSRALLATRAYENQVFVAYANRCGQEGTLEYLGASAIVAPDGAELARAGGGEELIVADVDPDAYAHSRAINTYRGDRRPELYARLASPHEP